MRTQEPAAWHQLRTCQKHTSGSVLPVVTSPMGVGGWCLGNCEGLWKDDKHTHGYEAGWLSSCTTSCWVTWPMTTWGKGLKPRGVGGVYVELQPELPASLTFPCSLDVTEPAWGSLYPDIQLRASETL